MTVDQALDIPTQAQPADVPSASLEAEAAVLGACLMATPAYDPVVDAMQVLADDGDWYDGGHETAWRAIVSLHGRSKPTGVPMV